MHKWLNLVASQPNSPASSRGSTKTFPRTKVMALRPGFELDGAPPVLTCIPGQMEWEEGKEVRTGRDRRQTKQSVHERRMGREGQEVSEEATKRLKTDFFAIMASAYGKIFLSSTDVLCEPGHLWQGGS